MLARVIVPAALARVLIASARKVQSGFRTG
jgi:hypothetical protein